jgi:transcriptional regulator with XRE-family HTH domain
MASFRLDIKPNRLAGARFVNRVRSKLQEALVADQKRTGITQSKIAAAIGVHRSVISRELNGRQDITLGRVAELAWAMGREIEFEVRVPEAEVGQNVPGIAVVIEAASHSSVLKSGLLKFESTASDRFRVKSTNEVFPQRAPGKFIESSESA